MKLHFALTRRLREQLSGLLAVGIASACTFGAIRYYSPSGELVPEAVATPSPVAPVLSSSPDAMVRVSGLLSQTKFVQNEDGTVYLNLAVEGPSELRNVKERSSVDVVVVLDRSGSMAEDRKLPFAKAAITELIDRLQDGDRFSLVTFDDAARTDVTPTLIAAGAKERLRSVVSTIQTGGGTNIGDGLSHARQLLRTAEADRRLRKIILLSDGQTNVGITDPKALNAMAKEIADTQVTVSTVGMGLGFNEVLMASLSDYGMGSYAFLERLDGLEGLFAKDLSDTRSIYAQGSFLEINLPNGVELIDAGGFPFEHVAGQPSLRRVRSGQILRGGKKQIALTYRIPTTTVGGKELGSVRLAYQVDGRETQLAVSPEVLALAVVPGTERAAAVASINQDLLRSTWSKNNLGIMQKRVHEWIAQGKDGEARAEIARYEQQASQLGGKVGAKLLDEKAEAELQTMRKGLEDAVSAKGAERDVKFNRYRKESQKAGYYNQSSGW